MEQTPTQSQKLKLRNGRTLLAIEYEQVKQRVKKGSEILKGKFMDPEYADKVELYGQLTTQMLEYEIENNLFPLLRNDN